MPTPDAPAVATEAVLLSSQPMPESAQPVRGVDFDAVVSTGRDITAADMVNCMAGMGFQASAVGDAARIIDDMVGGIPPLPFFSH